VEWIDRWPDGPEGLERDAERVCVVCVACLCAGVTVCLCETVCDSVCVCLSTGSRDFGRCFGVGE